MGRNGYSRGKLLVSKSKAKIQNELDGVSVHCFKCGFSSTTKNAVDEHMTFSHLIGAGSVMEKFIALSTPSLLISTLHRTDNESIFGGSDDASNKTEESNIDTETLDQLENYNVENELENFNPDSFLGSPRNDRSPGSCSNMSGVSKLSRNLSGAENEDLNVETNGRQKTLDVGFIASPEQNSFHNSTVTIQKNVVSEVLQRRPQPDLNVENAENSSVESRIQRVTSSGGIRSTPQRRAQKKINSGKKNLLSGSKKPVDATNIGQFNSKYKATARMKHIITKHSKEASEFLLKVNNSLAGGLKNKENGFFMAFKAGDKVFVASEGAVGKKFVEEDEYRAEVIKDAKVIDVKLNSPILTSLLKSQYGASNHEGTPKAHKRKNYKGIGAQNKKKKSNRENVMEENVSEKVSGKSGSKNIDDSLNTTDDSIDTNIDDDAQNRWLEEMIQDEIVPRKSVASKPPKKQPRQLYPFKCSECDAKYKTKKGFEKHLKEKHGLN